MTTKTERFDIFKNGDFVQSGATKETIMAEFDTLDWDQALECMNAFGFEIEGETVCTLD